MKISRVAYLFVELVLLMSFAVAQDPQSLSEEVRQRQVADVDLNQVTEVDALSRTLRAADLPGGIATVSTCGEEERFVITPAGPTLGETLDAIVATFPNYRWLVDRGAVNIFPLKNPPVLLDVVIADLKVEDNQTLDDIIREISEKPEVRSVAARFHLSPGFKEVGLSSLERPGSVNSEATNGLALRLHNVTVRQALNAVVRAHGNAIWSYKEKRCNGSDEFVINLVVR